MHRLGMEKAPRGFLASQSYERGQVQMGLNQNPMYWAMRARRHMHEYGTTIEQMAKVSVKNHKYGAANPYAMYQTPMTMEEVLGSKLVCDPITLFMICAPNEGAAAVILSSMEVARRLRSKPITLAASAHRRLSGHSWFFVPEYSVTAIEHGNPSPTLVAAPEAHNGRSYWAHSGRTFE